MARDDSRRAAKREINDAIGDLMQELEDHERGSSDSDDSDGDWMDRANEWRELQEAFNSDDESDGWSSDDASFSFSETDEEEREQLRRSRAGGNRRARRAENRPQ